MKLSIEKIKFLIEKYQDRVELVFLYDIFSKEKKFWSNNKINLEDVTFLKEKEYTEIDVMYSDTLYRYLMKEFPVEFRKPYGVINYLEMDRYLELLEQINARSGRRRSIHLIGEIYNMADSSNEDVVVLGHLEELTREKWNYAKMSINVKDKRFYYRTSENGIIIFVNLTGLDCDTSYVERFNKNTDLITAMVTQKKDQEVIIAPDFIPTEDVISVTNPDKLLNEYIKYNTRLIIVGENLSESYRTAMIRVKDYDKFVRMMVVQSIDPGNIHTFLNQVKKAYNSNRWTK